MSFRKFGCLKLFKHRPTIIAEVGVNHNCNLLLAKKYIRLCKIGGADAIKFQTFQTDLLVTDYAKKAKYQVKNVFTWLIENSTPEWVQLYASDIVNTFKNNGKLSELAMCVMNDPIIIKYFKGFEEILNK